MKHYCPKCQCEVVARWGKCPWCDSAVKQTVSAMPSTSAYIELPALLAARQIQLTTDMH